METGSVESAGEPTAESIYRAEPAGGGKDNESDSDKSPEDEDEPSDDMIDAEIDKCFDVEIMMIQEKKKDDHEQITDGSTLSEAEAVCSQSQQSDTQPPSTSEHDRLIATVETQLVGGEANCSDGDMVPGVLSSHNEVPSSEQSCRTEQQDLTPEGQPEIPTVTTSSATAVAAATNFIPEPSSDTLYHLKWVEFNGIRTPIITQRENGPCPLIAIMNVLLMSSRASLPLATEVVTSELLIQRLADCLLKQPQNLTENAQLDYQQNVNDAMAVIPRLQTGIDVNVKFTGVRDFEYTPECIVFDLLNISLYHGWLIESEAVELKSYVDNCSYNQLVEKIIEWKSHHQPEVINQAFLAESFLNETAAQLTYQGLCELNSTLKDDEMCVFFRNNHFSTLYKHNNGLWLLVTDQGFLSESQIVWESLDNVEGDSVFVDGSFRRVEHGTGPVFPPPDPNLTPAQLQDHDLMVAMALQQQEDSGQPLSEFTQPGSSIDTDHALAMQLQAEEERQSALEQRGERPPPAAHSSGGGRNMASPPASSRPTTGASGSSTKEKDDKCRIL